MLVLGGVRSRLGGGLVVDRSDGGLELEGTDRTVNERGLDQPDPAIDEGAVPEGTVLLGQQRQITLSVDPGVHAGVGEQHEGQQAGGLGVCRDRVEEGFGQPYGLNSQIQVEQRLTRRGGVALSRMGRRRPWVRIAWPLAARTLRTQLVSSPSMDTKYQWPR